MADLAMAYRTIPTSQPWFTTVGFFNPTSIPPRPEYYWLPGHNFGLASAVVNFNRYPEFVVVSLRALYAVPVDHTTMTTALLPTWRLADVRASASLKNSSPCAAAAPHAPPVSPFDPSKTKEPNASNVVLGIVADLASVPSPHPTVHFRADPERVTSVLASFRLSFHRRRLSPHEASSLRGKLFFILSSAYVMVGRAATLPLVQRQYRDTTSAFLPQSELHHSLLFFEALLPNLPPLAVPLSPPQRRPLLVYTDASFSRATVRRAEARGAALECSARRPRLRGGLGAVVYDPEDGVARVAAADPNWRVLLSSWRDDFKTYIAELETLAAISVYTTFPDLFAGRAVTHYVDNTVALSALVNGYAGKPELARSVNIFYLQAVALRTSVYFDYVPSKANIADLPSRRMFSELDRELMHMRRTTPPSQHLVVPSVSAWHGDLSAWAHHESGASAHFVS
jgi:hypothetical protein